jgi:hypothetical protein
LATTLTATSRVRPCTDLRMGLVGLVGVVMAPNDSVRQ